MSEWQPIETAPRDGNHILACKATDADGRPISKQAFDIHVHNVAWWGEDGGWIVYNSLIRENRCFFDPTHWMPLPEPPDVSQTAR